jgi:glutathione S-transferase
MADFTISMGNRNYSSWSLRAWLALKQTGAEFDEVVIPLDRPETRGAILQRSPNGKVPALDHNGLVIWDSLAIAEYLAGLFPKAGLWPSDAAARGVARAVSAEMHSGFADLRRDLPMDIRNTHPMDPPQEGTQRDISRVLAIWDDCRGRFGNHGDFLFGGFTIADAFYAPVVSRFKTYGVPVGGRAREYCDAVLAHPAMVEWSELAAEEPWVIDDP